MPRPKSIKKDVAAELLIEAERMLCETHGRRLVLSELAARIGISQSYTHQFFPTKADLIRAIAQKWFAEIEAKAIKISAQDLPASERLELWVLDILRLKRDRFDANPILFNAYLELAGDHMDIVAEHVQKLRQTLEQILQDMVKPDKLNASLCLVEDATMLFRLPHNISRFREQVTDDRARAVVRALKLALR